MFNKTQKQFWSWLMILGMVVVIGCVPSVHPIYTDADLIYEPAYVGTYGQENSSVTWTLARRDEKSYVLTHKDESGVKSRYVARVAEIDGLRFLDLTVDPAERGSGLHNAHLLPIHTIYLIKDAGPSVTLGSVDYKWFNEQMSGNPPALPYVEVDNARYITAPTEKLQKFLVANNDKFSAEIRLVRQSK